MSAQEILAAGLIIFFVTHIAAGLHEFRSSMVARIGTQMYRLIHAIFAAGSLAMIVIGFADGEFGEAYAPPSWGRAVSVTLMPVAFTLIAGAYLSRGLGRIVRHPLLSGIALFSILHLLGNGDWASVQVFGSFLAYSLLAMFLADRKQRLGDPGAWEAKQRETALVPFAALAAGKAGWTDCKPGLLRAVLAGVIIYAAFGALHGILIGVRVLF